MLVTPAVLERPFPDNDRTHRAAPGSWWTYDALIQTGVNMLFSVATRTHSNLSGALDLKRERTDPSYSIA